MVELCISFGFLYSKVIFGLRDFPNTHATRWQTDCELKPKRTEAENWTLNTEYWMLRDSWTNNKTNPTPTHTNRHERDRWRRSIERLEVSQAIERVPLSTRRILFGGPKLGGGYICYSAADWVEWIRVERSYAGSGLGVYSSAIWLHFFNGARKHLQFQRQNSGAK